MQTETLKLKSTEAMQQPKTVCEELSDNLTKEEFVLAGKYIQVGRLDAITGGVCTDLKRLFVWSKTEEGFDYWNNIYSRLSIANP